MRASGRTTRQVDELVQSLFNNRGTKIVVQDHFSIEDNVSVMVYMRTNKFLAEKVARRIDAEHRNAKVKITQDRVTTYIQID